jgi:hypothetical protein
VSAPSKPAAQPPGGDSLLGGRWVGVGRRMPIPEEEKTHHFQAVFPPRPGPDRGPATPREVGSPSPLRSPCAIGLSSACGTDSGLPLARPD